MVCVAQVRSSVSVMCLPRNLKSLTLSTVTLSTHSSWGWTVRAREGIVLVHNQLLVCLKGMYIK